MNFPSIRSVGKALRRKSEQRRLPLLYAGFALVVFLVALVVTFPHETLVRQSLYSATVGSDTTIDFTALHFRPPLAYQVDDLQIRPDRNEPFELRITKLHVAPALFSLLIPGQRNAVDLELEIWGGQLEARLAGDPDDFAIAAAGSKLNLAEAISTALPTPGKIYGNAQFELVAEGTDKGRSIAGSLTLAIRDLALRELTARGFKVPDLTFETVDLAVDADGGVLHVRKFVASGNEVSIRATGKVTLHRSWKRSALELRFELSIDEDAPSGLRVLPRLLPKRKNGESFYDIRGTLGNPRIQ